MAFPSLSTPPVVTSFSEEAAINPVISSPKEAGYVQTRATFSRTPPDKWHCLYPNMTAAEKVLLKAHQTAVKVGADIWAWTNPVDSVSYDVRFMAPIKFNLENSFDSTGAHTWSAEFDLEQV